MAHGIRLSAHGARHTPYGPGQMAHGAVKDREPKA